MTCIAGLVDDSKTVWIGADSIISNSWNIFPAAPEKIFQTGQYLIACSGDSRLAQIIQYEVSFPEPTDDIELLVNTTIVGAIREAGRRCGYIRQENGREKIDGKVMLGISGGHLYVIEEDLCVLPASEGFAAIGSAYVPALAVLYDLQEEALDPKVRLHRALDAAHFCHAGVRRPFVVKSIAPLADNSGEN